MTRSNLPPSWRQIAPVEQVGVCSNGMHVQESKQQRGLPAHAGDMCRRNAPTPAMHLLALGLPCTHFAHPQHGFVFDSCALDGTVAEQPCYASLNTTVAQLLSLGSSSTCRPTTMPPPHMRPCSSTAPAVYRPVWAALGMPEAKGSTSTSSLTLLGKVQVGPGCSGPLLQVLSTVMAVVSGTLGPPTLQSGPIMSDTSMAVVPLVMRVGAHTW